MARLLAIDWDHRQLQVVSAVIRGGKATIETVRTWQDQKTPNPAEAAELGLLLRQRLKEAGIAPAPVVVCIGRDRVILKEIHHPRVPKDEEAQVIRFQAIKELSSTAEEVVIDYVSTSSTGSDKEQRALVLILRRELLETYRTLCKAAGLKLLALTPRPFGAAACLAHSPGQGPGKPADSDASLAIVSTSGPWLEFCVVRGRDLHFARSISLPESAPETALPGEINRNLAIHDAQSSQHPVRALYVANAELCTRLRSLMSVPVHLLDPFAGQEGLEVTEGARGTYAAAVGLLQVKAAGQLLPINFVEAKEPKPPSNPNKMRLILAASLLGIIAVAALGFGYLQLSQRDQELKGLLAKNQDLESQWHLLEEDARRIAAMNEWNNSEIVWLDELYDLTERFPDEKLRLRQFLGAPLASTSSTQAVAALTLKIRAKDGPKTVGALIDQMIKDDRFYIYGDLRLLKNPMTDSEFSKEYQASLRLLKRPPEEYTRRLNETRERKPISVTLSLSPAETKIESGKEQQP